MFCNLSFLHKILNSVTTILNLNHVDLLRRQINTGRVKVWLITPQVYREQIAEWQCNILFSGKQVKTSYRVKWPYLLHQGHRCLCSKHGRPTGSRRPWEARPENLNCSSCNISQIPITQKLLVFNQSLHINDTLV